MARYNEILVGRFNRSLQKLMSMKGEPPAPQLATEITPSLQLPLGTEYRYLESWNRYGFFILSNASVGAFSGIRLRNPATSGVIAVVEKLSFRVGAVEEVNLWLGPVATDLTSVNTNMRRLDARTGTIASALVLSTGTNPPALGALQLAVYDMSSNPNTDRDYVLFEDQEFCILPGDAFQIDGSVLNTAIKMNMQYRERALEESERS